MKFYFDFFKIDRYDVENETGLRGNLQTRLERLRCTFDRLSCFLRLNERSPNRWTRD